jgi:beta-glucosidase
LRFVLREADLAFSRRDKTFGAEPGMFDIWVGGDSNAAAHAEFEFRNRD